MSDNPPRRPPTAEQPAVSPELSGLRLDELLDELQDRLTRIAETRDRLQGLLDAVLEVGSELELDATLNRIVSSASALVHARYGALGVLGPDGELARFVHVGMDDEIRNRLGDLPEGHGLLGELLRSPTTLRLDDLEQHPSAVGIPAAHPRMHSFLGTPIQVRGEVFGNLYLTEKADGGQFGPDDEIVLRALAAAAGVAVENARLFEQAKLRHQWSEASSEITTELLSGGSTEDALRLIARRALEIAQADCALIVFARRGRPGNPARVEAVAGDVDIQIGLPVATNGPVLGTSLTEDAPTLDSDVSRTPHGGLHRLLPDFGPALAVPLRSDEATAGAVIVLREKGRPRFGTEQVPLVTSFADQTAIALEFAAKHRVQRRLDVTEERERIARDLHDHVVQRLFATGLGLRSALQRVESADVGRRLQQSMHQLDETVRELRTSIYNLYAEGEGDEGNGLRRRLLDVVADAGNAFGITPSVRISGPVDTSVPVTYSWHAEAVVREGISNAIRHGAATEITISIDSSDSLSIEIIDNGTGFDPDSPRSGLRNLQERAVQCAGALTITSTDGGGTHLLWQVPLVPATEI
ncbi:sensor histidine kinase [Parasphingorhabdus pacifica]